MTAATQQQQTNQTGTGPRDEGMIMPEHRDLHFLPPRERIEDWHRLGAHMSQFMNTLSLFFPAGERLFIDAVRAFRDEIPDPDLRKAAAAFISQEAMHSREHAEYNRLMDEAGLPAARLDQLVTQNLEWFKKHGSREDLLAETIALEHFTALMGGFMLDHPEVIEGSQEDYRRMWEWHAMEEVEHKAVCFDVWEKCVGRGPRAYLHRSVGMLRATVLFWTNVTRFYLQMSAASEACREEGWRGHLTVLNTLLWRPGLLRRQMPAWLEFFQYSFHPWQQDNSRHIAQLEELAEEAQEAYRQARAADASHH